MEIAIDVQNLKKNYGKNTAVSNITFQVQKGEIFCLLGPNGAGKSTIIKMLCTLLYPTSGTAFILGKDIRTQSNKIKSSIGYLPDESFIYEQLTVYRFLKYFSNLYNVNKFEKRINDLSSILDVNESIFNKFLGNLSLGQRKKVLLMKTLIHDPDIILLDEPTAGLDPISKKKFINYILRLNKEGKTIFLNTHNLYDAEKVCDSVAILNKEILLYGKYSQLKKTFHTGKNFEILARKKNSQENINSHNMNEIESFELDGDLNSFKDKLDELNAKNYEITSLKTIEPSLEDIFIKKTIKNE